MHWCETSGSEYPLQSRLLANRCDPWRRFFRRGSLFYCCQSLLCREVKYKDEILPGEQPAIMDRVLFDAVQQKLTEQWTTDPTQGTQAPTS